MRIAHRPPTAPQSGDATLVHTATTADHAGSDGRPAKLQHVRAGGNRLLAKLADADDARLQPLLELVHVAPRDMLFRKDHPVSHVYFPCNAGLSSIVRFEGGGVVEVGTVGNEGFAGVELLIGGTVATETLVCQIGGACLRMTAADFRRAVATHSPLRHVCECYFQVYLSQMSQSVGCNRLHPIEARFAKWLLVTHDRVMGDEFYLTQEFLADMLGVARQGVSAVAASFQKAGLIRYNRGVMRVLDRAALERESCECYRTVRSQFERLLGIPYG